MAEKAKQFTAMSTTARSIISTVYAKNRHRGKVKNQEGTGTFFNFPIEKMSASVYRVLERFRVKSIGVQDESSLLVHVIFIVLKQDLCILDKSTCGE